MWLIGRITFANGQNSFAAIRSFEVTPIGLAQGTLCIRGTVATEEGSDPGNVGVGVLSTIPGGRFTILTARLHLQQWFNPFPGDQTGPDQISCTDDDPGFESATDSVRELRVYLRLSSPIGCCGDCDGNGSVTIDEIVTGVGNALSSCPAQ